MITIQFLLLIILTWKVLAHRDFESPTIYWAFIWFISTFLAFLNPYGMLNLTNKAIFLIGVGIFSFIIGAEIYTGRTISNEKKSKGSFLDRVKENIDFRSDFNKKVVFSLSK